MMTFKFIHEIVLGLVLVGIISHLMGAIAIRLFKTKPATAIAASQFAAASSLFCIVSAGILSFCYGPFEWSLHGMGLIANGLSFGFAFTVDCITLIVLLYANRYLVENRAQQPFFFWAHLCVFIVLILGFANNLGLIWLALAGTSLGLHQLLTIYPERNVACATAKLNSIIARIGDVSLLVACVLLYQSFKTLQISELNTLIQSQIDHPYTVSLAAALVVVAAMTKSAQVPFHGWLSETIDMPTPVSALMHAGIISAGGFLGMRTFPLIHITWAPELLCILGILTVFISGTTMLAVPDIKRRLAHSTSAQMGFMFVQLGLGIPGAALMHMIGHAFYKAYMFLSSGELSRYSQEEYRLTRIPLFEIALILGIGAIPFILYGINSPYIPHDMGATVGLSITTIAIAAGLTYIIRDTTSHATTVSVSIVGSILALGLSTLSLRLGNQLLLIEGHSIGNIISTGAAFLIFGIFVLLFLIQSLFPRFSKSLRIKLIVLAKNGFYLSAISQKILGVELK